MAGSEKKYVPRLYKKYKEEVVPKMMKEFGYKSVMAVPRIEKVVLNMGIGEAINDPEYLDKAVEELTLISGQRAVKTYAKKSVSNFKLRKGHPIGCKVTLRGYMLYDFIDRLINIALPRVRDFKGISSSSFDGRGNYSLGIKEQIVFPEIDYDSIKEIHGLDINIVTTAETDEEARALLKFLGFPFRD